MSRPINATLASLVAEPVFRSVCQYVQGLTYSAAARAPFAGLPVFDLATLQLPDIVGPGETAFEAALRAAIGAGHGASDLYKATAKLHGGDAATEDFIALYAPVVIGAAGITVRGAAVAVSGPLETLYLQLSFLKYFVYGQTNYVSRAYIQRVHTFLFLYLAALYLRFKQPDGSIAPTPEAGTPDPAAPPLSYLLDICKARTRAIANPTLNKALTTDASGQAQASSALADQVRAQQMSLGRAVTSITAAHKQFADEVKQLCGFTALLVVCVGVFYGWMRYRPALWARMRVPMATSALVAAAVVLIVTGVAIARPVERFEQEYETFCTASGQCEQAMQDWAAEAANEATSSVLSATTDMAKREFATRQQVLMGDLAAVSQRVQATDIGYRDALFRFNRVRQAKRFVVMTLAVALLLMVLIMMGLPRRVAIGLHVAAAVIILTVAVLVYRGNAQRSRKNWNVLYFPRPDGL